MSHKFLSKKQDFRLRYHSNIANFFGFHLLTDLHKFFSSTKEIESPYIFLNRKLYSMQRMKLLHERSILRVKLTIEFLLNEPWKLLF